MECLKGSGLGRRVTTAVCKMIGVLRNKWGIEMTNGAAELQLGCEGCGGAAERPDGSFGSAKKNKNGFALSTWKDFVC